MSVSILKIATFVLIGLAVAGNRLSAAELKMSYNSDWPPYSSGVGSTVRGILPDLITEIVEKRMGIKVNHHGYPWKRAQHAVERGNLDAMVTVPTENRLAYSRSSLNTVYTIDMRPVVATGGAAEKKISAVPMPETLRNLRLCEIFGNGWGARFADKYDLAPFMATKVSSCLRMTANGRTDVVVQSLAVANRGIAANKLGRKLTVLPTSFGKMKFTFLLSKMSTVDADFIANFDASLGEMIANGSYTTLVDRLRSGTPQ